MKSRLVWLALATFLVSAMPGSVLVADPRSETVVAEDDHLSTLRGQGLTILPEELLANDPGVTDDHSPEIVFGTSHGQLSNAAIGFLYTPEPNFYGEDFFRYSIGGETADVFITVALPWVPMSLDWDGDGFDEIGWFDSKERDFYLADTLTNPVFEIWKAPGGTPGGKPFAGDWDGDGFDDLAIYDPGTGRVHLLMAESPGQLEEIETFSWGPLHGDIRPVAGDWDGDLIDDVGVYDPTSATFDLRFQTPGGAPVSLSHAFGNPENDNRPVAADWLAEDRDLGAIYDPVERWFCLPDADGTPQHPIGVDFGEAPNLFPVAGLWPTLGLGIGLYDPREDLVELISVDNPGGHPIPAFPPDHPNNVPQEPWPPDK